MFTQLLTLPPIPLNQAKERLKFSAGLEKVVMRALSKEPASRYPDVLAFSTAFYEAAHNPVSSEPEAQAKDEAGGILGRMRGIFGSR
jgi:eukaryotic-like serine/threonine-protein kinase